MILPSDKEYKHVKKIKQDKLTINPDFKELADWIDKEYNVKTLEIIYGTRELENCPCLNIIFEFEKDKIVFQDSRHRGYDKSKQKSIADKFNEFQKKKSNAESISKYKDIDTWVIYSAFEPIAKIEANQSIPEYLIKKLKRDIKNKNLWKIRRFFAGVTFFFYKDSQIKSAETDGLQKKYSELYFSLLKKNDEFDYFNKNNYSIYLDSKENFDKNYDSNWFYYSK